MAFRCGNEGARVDPAFDLYGSLVEPERLVYPVSIEEQKAFIDRISNYHDMAGHVAIVDGAFDVPHEGHSWYLRRCRMEAAKRHYGDTFENADKMQRIQMIADSVLMLVVNVDADHKLASLKAFKPDKGNLDRPVYPWQARANIVGGYMI